MKMHQAGADSGMRIEEFIQKVGDVDATLQAGNFYISDFKKDAQKILDGKGRRSEDPFYRYRGIGISGLAQYMHFKGHEITGSDIADSRIVRILRDKGIEVTIPHNKRPSAIRIL